MSGNRAQFSTQAGCISADQKRIGDHLDEHIAVLTANQQAGSVGGRTVFEAVHNATRAISEELSRELSILAGRQAASAALQVVQFFLFAGYLITLAVLYVVKTCKKHSKKRDEKKCEEKVELLEQRLQERKSRRRAAAARQSSADK